MTPRPILSILTPAVPSRFEKLQKLSAELERQIGGLPVEHLTLLDNKRRTVGEKRDALLRAARGEYVAFVDDDDDVSTDYIPELLKATETKPDVITFVQLATVNGQRSRVEFRLGSPNEAFQPDGTTRRSAWHVCAWRRELAVLSRFPATNYGEDWAYAAQLCSIPGLREAHVPKVLHFYIHDLQHTEAPPPGQ